MPAGHARLAARAARGSANGAMARSLDGIDLAALRVRTAAGEPCPGLGAAVPAPRSAACASPSPVIRCPSGSVCRAWRGGCRDRGTSAAVVAGTAGRCCRARTGTEMPGGLGGQPRGSPAAAAPAGAGSRGARRCPARSAAPRSLPSLPGWQIIPTDIAKDVVSAAKRKQMGNEELLDAWRFGFCGLFVVIEV